MRIFVEYSISTDTRIYAIIISPEGKQQSAGQEVHMKELQLTTDELRTLVWALNSKLNQERMRCIEEGKPYGETVKRLSNMCGRSYYLLTQSLYEEAR